jgi:hypothetical protein
LILRGSTSQFRGHPRTWTQPQLLPFPLHAITDAGDRTYGGTVVSATYRDLFATVATAAGALTGLLFVALSLVPRRGSGSGLSVIQQVRAAAAWLAFTNALAVALFGLVPGTNVGYPALVLGVIGIAFTVAGIRSILASRATSRQQLRQVGLVVLLLLEDYLKVLSLIAARAQYAIVIK